MAKKLNILGINGSVSPNSSNLSILNAITDLGKEAFNLTILDDLTELPHFKTESTDNNVPEEIVLFRNTIAAADGIIFPRQNIYLAFQVDLKMQLNGVYQLSFSDKPIGLITASANGVKGHEELKLIMKTVQTKFTKKTTLLIQGVRGKMDEKGNIIDTTTKNEVTYFVKAYIELIKKMT